MLVTKVFSFDGAHKLLDYKGKCERLHGHTWVLHVTVQGDVGPGGIAFDFARLKEIVKDRVISVLDHTYLNEVLDEPSAENIALWAWSRLEGLLPLYEIKVFESPTSYVTYRPGPPGATR